MAEATNTHEYQPGIARLGKLIEVKYSEPRPYITGGMFLFFGSIKTEYRRDVLEEIREPGVAICVRCHEEPQHPNHDTVARADRQ